MGIHTVWSTCNVHSRYDVDACTKEKVYRVSHVHVSWLVLSQLDTS